jgi:mersacidin/lichenicidin family type 2 lantibiotic
MGKLDVSRAWKDENYFGSLSEVDRQMIPSNPAGLTALTNEEIAGIEGGTTGTIISAMTTIFITAVTCGITLCSCLVEDCSNKQSAIS